MDEKILIHHPDDEQARRALGFYWLDEGWVQWMQVLSRFHEIDGEDGVQAFLEAFARLNPGRELGEVLAEHAPATGLRKDVVVREKKKYRFRDYDPCSQFPSRTTTPRLGCRACL